MKLTKEIGNRIVDFIFEPTGYIPSLGTIRGFYCGFNQQLVGVLLKGKKKYLI
jgi:hypothetical protein